MLGGGSEESASSRGDSEARGEGLRGEGTVVGGKIGVAMVLSRGGGEDGFLGKKMLGRGGCICLCNFDMGMVRLGGVGGRGAWQTGEASAWNRGKMCV